jgi:hypothetical protein
MEVEGRFDQEREEKILYYDCLTPYLVDPISCIWVALGERCYVYNPRTHATCPGKHTVFRS